MTRLNEEQSRLLSKLTQKTYQRSEVFAHLQVEFERRKREKTEELDAERLRLVAQLLDMKTPKRQIGLALGTENWYKLSDIIDKAQMLADQVNEEEGDYGTVTVTKPDDETIVVRVNSWSDWPLNPDFYGRTKSGQVTFSEVEPGEWMPTADDDLSVAVERELFNDGGSERLKSAFANA